PSQRVPLALLVQQQTLWADGRQPPLPRPPAKGRALCGLALLLLPGLWQCERCSSHALLFSIYTAVGIIVNIPLTIYLVLYRFLYISVYTVFSIFPQATPFRC